MYLRMKLKLTISVFIVLISTFIGGYIMGLEDMTEEELIVINNSMKPVILLDGSSITITAGEKYEEPGYIAYDNEDGNLTSKVKIKNEVDDKVPGEYQVIYEVTDSDNNLAKVIRSVTVKSKYDATDSKIANIKTYQNTKTDKQEINDYIIDLNKYLSKYKVSVGYINLKNRFTYLYDEKKTYFGASLIKNIDAMYIYENNITDKKVLGDVKKAISVSDNDAHANLVKYIGIERFRSYASSIGGTLSNCHGTYFCDSNILEQLAFFDHLYLLINTLDNGDELASYYINNHKNYLSFDKKYTNIHKYGVTSPYFHDAGIFLGDNPYIIVVLTAEKGNKEISYNKLINNISKKISKLNELVGDIS